MYFWLNYYGFNGKILGKIVLFNAKLRGYCYFIADILTKFFLEMFVEWSSTKHNFCPNLST